MANANLHSVPPSINDSSINVQVAGHPEAALLPSAPLPMCSKRSAEFLEDQIRPNCFSKRSRLSLDSALDSELGRVNGRPVLIKVGEGAAERDFWIHESLAVSSSHFLRSALSGSWLESVEKIIRLPREEASIFEVYFVFLYEKRIRFPVQDEGDEETSNWWPISVLAWVLGDFLQDIEFKDSVIDHIIAQTNKAVNGYCFFPIKEVTTLAYRLTVPGSALRRLIVDQHVYHGLSAWLGDTEIDKLDKQFLLDLSTTLLEQRPKPCETAPDRCLSTCAYHEHSADNSHCYKAN